jgi:hypothetical protein
MIRLIIYFSLVLVLVSCKDDGSSNTAMTRDEALAKYAKKNGGTSTEANTISATNNWCVRMMVEVVLKTEGSEKIISDTLSAYTLADLKQQYLQAISEPEIRGEIDDICKQVIKQLSDEIEFDWKATRQFIRDGQVPKDALHYRK